MVLDSFIKLWASAINRLHETHTFLRYINFLTKVNVRDYVLEKALEQSKAIAEKTQIDAAWVLIEQKRVYDMCMDQELEFKNASSANKALENIGKHVDVNAFKATDDDGVPIDQNWVLTIVDAKPHDSKKTGKAPVGKKAK